MKRPTLVRKLAALSPQDFEVLVAAIPNAATHISRHGTIPENAADLIRWAESPGGCQLTTILECLHTTLLETKPLEAAEPSPERPSGIPHPPEFYAVPPYTLTTTFVGRRAELGDLDEWAPSPDPVMVVESIGGMGKSALTWEWVREQAETRIPNLAGRMWWSFYERGTSMTSFLRHALAYVTQRELRTFRNQHAYDTAQELLYELRRRPYLLVLDGFERVLTAYHRIDKSQVRDDRVLADKRECTNPKDGDSLRQLVHAGRSRILISTRLMPKVLEDKYTHRPIPGVRHLELEGLAPADVLDMVRGAGIQGDEDDILQFAEQFGRHCLILLIVCGMITDYRASPGNFDAWRADPHAGGSLKLSELPLKQRYTHILEYAFRGLNEKTRQLLSRIAILSDGADYATIAVLNPFLPPPPPKPPEPPPPKPPAVPSVLLSPSECATLLASFPPFVVGDGRVMMLHPSSPAPPLKPFDLDQWQWPPVLPTASEGLPGADDAPDRRVVPELADEVSTSGPDRDSEGRARAMEQYKEAMLEYSDRRRAAIIEFQVALSDLEDRSLLQWDRETNTYDLHPVVRAYAFEQLDEQDRARSYDSIRDHFASLPPENLKEATELAHVKNRIEIMRTLIGAGWFAKSVQFYRGPFADSLLFSIGAYHTMIELLRPLVGHGPNGTPILKDVGDRIYVTNDLAIALEWAGRPEEALPLYRDAMKLALDPSKLNYLMDSLSNWSDCIRNMNALAVAERAETITRQVAEAAGLSHRLTRTLLDQIACATMHGRFRKARSLYAAFRRRTPPPLSLYREGDADYRLAVLRFYQGRLRSRLLEQAERVAAAGRNLRRQCQLAALRAEWELSRGNPVRALPAIENALSIARRTGFPVQDYTLRGHE